MRKNKILIMTAILLFAGVGTIAAFAGAGQLAEIQNTNLTKLQEFKVSVAGEELTLPISYKELKSKGWTMKPSQVEMESYSERQMVGEFEPVFPYFYKNNAVLSANATNGGPIARPLMDLTITNFYFHRSGEGGQEPDVVLPGNIALGKSTGADVRAAYGEPTFKYVGDGSGYTSLIYALGEYQSIRFTYDNDEHQIIDGISITNEKDVYTKNMEYASN